MKNLAPQHAARTPHPAGGAAFGILSFHDAAANSTERDTPTTSQTPEIPKKTESWFSMLLTAANITKPLDRVLYFDALEEALVTYAAMRAGEASPLPGDEEVVDKIHAVLSNTYEDEADAREHTQSLVLLISSYREQATAPLRMGLDSSCVAFEHIIKNAEAGTAIKAIAEDGLKYAKQQLAAHPTKAESQEVDNG